MTFNVQENAVFLPEFSKKNLPTVPSNALPLLGRFAPSLWPPPPLKNPGYASVESDPTLRCLHVPLRGRKQKCVPPRDFAPPKLKVFRRA